jgi:HEAT repeat protein
MPTRTLEQNLEALKSPKVKERRRAASELRYSQDDRITVPLIEALRDPDVDVRCDAAMALGFSRKTLAFEPLCEALKDSNLDVQKSVINAIGNLGDPKGVEVLTALFRDPEVPGKYWIALSIASIGGRTAFIALCQSLSLDREDMRSCALGAFTSPIGWDAESRDPETIRRLCDE